MSTNRENTATEEQTFNNLTKMEPKSPDQEHPEEDSIMKYNRELDEIARNSLSDFINKEKKAKVKKTTIKRKKSKENNHEKMNEENVSVPDRFHSPSPIS